MDPTHLSFHYERDADILYVHLVAPYAAPESDELGDDVIARCHPTTGAVEGLELLFFSTRLLRDSDFSLPLVGQLRRAD